MRCEAMPILHPTWDLKYVNERLVTQPVTSSFDSWCHLRLKSQIYGHQDSSSANFAHIVRGVDQAFLGGLRVFGPLFDLLYQPRMMDDNECGTVGVMIDKGNRSTNRKPAAVPLCPPQIPHDLTPAAAVGRQRLIACRYYMFQEMSYILWISEVH
jgi:hypothetical protein